MSLELEHIDSIINNLIRSYFKCKRRELKLTGKQVGDLLYISQQHISRYERGETKIPFSVIIFFLKSYNLNIDDFFNYLLDRINLYYKDNCICNEQ